MAETLELQQVVCPSCKQVISSFSPFAAEVECPFCHNKAFNPLITAKKTPIPERLIVFKTNEKDFEHALIDNLIARDYVPTDIFQSINPGNVIKAYLPMYLYEGRFQSSWSCQMAYMTTEVQASLDGKSLKNKKVKRFVPHSGNSQGNFSFLCLAYDGNDIPEELRHFCSQFPYNVMSSKEYDPALLGLDSGESPMTLALNTDTDCTWNKYGDSLVNRLAEQNALQQLQGREIVDFRASNSYELNHNGRYVLAPFWFVYYTYDNRQYYFLMDGLGENCSMSAPEDALEIAFVKKKRRIKKIVKWLWPLAIVVGWLASDFGVALVLFVLWFIAKWVVNKVMETQIKNRLSASREKRKVEAARLG
ncbi:MAG: hypothetical protein NC324_04955 [Bacteroides sp.]|nr:hypothetical protein [Bacteroides sp.]